MNSSATLSGLIATNDVHAPLAFPGYNLPQFAIYSSCNARPANVEQDRTDNGTQTLKKMSNMYCYHTGADLCHPQHL